MFLYFNPHEWHIQYILRKYELCDNDNYSNRYDRMELDYTDKSDDKWDIIEDDFFVLNTKYIKNISIDFISYYFDKGPLEYYNNLNNTDYNKDTAKQAGLKQLKLTISILPNILANYCDLQYNDNDSSTNVFFQKNFFEMYCLSIIGTESKLTEILEKIFNEQNTIKI